MKVAFYKSRHRLFDALVRMWSRKAYSHCELIVESFNGQTTCLSSSFRDGGVRMKTITLDPSRWDIVDVPFFVPKSRAHEWSKAHEGQGYDVLGLLGFVVRPIRGSSKRWVCSEAVADVLGFADSWRFDLAVLHSVLTRQKA